LGVFASCEAFSGKVVARVNGEKITVSELEKAVLKKLSFQMIQNLPGPAALRDLKEEVLAEIINGKIIEQRARELNIKVDDREVDRKLEEIKMSYEGAVGAKVLMEAKINDKQWKRDFKKRLLYELVIQKDVYDRITVDDNEARDFYKKNINNYPAETRIRLAQIVLDDEEKAYRILAHIKNGTDFSEAAKTESISPEGARGGDLGFITRNVMPVTVDRVAFNLPVGKVSDVVVSSYGYHILKVLEREEIKKGDFERVKENVIADIKAIKGEEAFQIWLDGLKSKAKIEIDEKVLESFMAMNASINREVE